MVRTIAKAVWRQQVRDVCASQIATGAAFGSQRIWRRIQRCSGRTIQFPGVTKLGCRNGAANWAEWSFVPFGRVGCPGASQSFGLRVFPLAGSLAWGPGANFSATERAHKRNGGWVAAEWRQPSLVTTSGRQPIRICGVQKS